MLTKTNIEQNQKILKKLRQGVNISLKRQVRPNIFNVNMFYLTVVTVWWIKIFS
jgi:hypothetical protein